MFHTKGHRGPPHLSTISKKHPGFQPGLGAIITISHFEKGIRFPITSILFYWIHFGFNNKQNRIKNDD
jgi:hypothetical protein